MLVYGTCRTVFGHISWLVAFPVHIQTVKAFVLTNPDIHGVIGELCFMMCERALSPFWIRCTCEPQWQARTLQMRAKLSYWTVWKARSFSSCRTPKNRCQLETWKTSPDDNGVSRSDLPVLWSLFVNILYQSELFLIDNKRELKLFGNNSWCCHLSWPVKPANLFSCSITCKRLQTIF